MTQVLLCNQPLNLGFLHNMSGIDKRFLDDLECDQHDENLGAYKPYIRGKATAKDKQIISPLNSPKVAKTVTDISLAIGAESTITLAEFNTNILGVSTGGYSARGANFHKALEQYQQKLLLYRAAVDQKSHSQHMFKKEVLKSFKELQSKFNSEIQTMNASIRARRGTALSNPNRGLNIARSSKVATSLNVTSFAQAQQLARFANYANHLGNGLVVIDFGTRIGEIKNSYDAGENWHREMFVQSSGFAATTSLGVLTGKAIAGGITLLIAAGATAGSIVLVGAVLVGFSVYGVSKLNHYINKNSGEFYDGVMESVTTWY